MKPLLIIACFLFTVQSVNSQQTDTIYYNYKWQVCEKPFAEYYRFGIIAVDSFWHYRGKVQDFYIDGAKQMEGMYNDKGMKEGLFSFYYPGGKLEAQGSYRSDRIYGFWNYYYPGGSQKEKIYYTGDETLFTVIESFDSTGKMILKDGTGKFETSVMDFDDSKHYLLNGEFTDGARSGTWKYFVPRSSGQVLVYEELYEDGKFKEGKFYPALGKPLAYKKKGVAVIMTPGAKFSVTESFSVDETKAAPGITDLRQELSSDTLYGNSRDSVGAFTNVEIAATYPGGTGSWNKFLERSLNPFAGEEEVPKKAKSFTQTVWVQFIVCTDGTVCNIQTMNVVLPSLKKEAERVIRLSGKWIPAVKNGRSVKAYRKQPITFQYINE